MNVRLVMRENNISFKDFLLRNKRNRTILWLAGVAVVVQFCVFKYLYPTASFLYGDSYAYINTAYYNLDINTYMVGYSRFLRLFSVFTTSDTALIAFVYLFIQSISLFLLFTLYYFYKPGKLIQTVLLCVTIFSPLSLHLANLISSDGLFLALSLTWFALLIWIINKPSWQIIAAHAIVLFIAFTVRYNGLIYPFISAAAFGISRLPLQRKIIGIASGVLLCASFITYTCYKYKQLTGYWQYSPFSGWQLANNAMYAYRYVDSVERKPVPQKFRVLDNMIREYFDSSRDVIKHPQEAVQASTIYMCTPGLPLWKYANDSTGEDFKKWATVAPFFKEYGIMIIKKYPWQFIRYFMWPNSQKYYASDQEFLETYNMGQNTIATLEQSWFNYKTPWIYTRFKSWDLWTLRFYPIFSAIINAVMVCGLICYIILKSWVNNIFFGKGILIGVIIWATNAGFTILASSAALRFQAFPLLITTIFSGFLLECIWGIAFYRQAGGIQAVSKEKILNEVIA